MPDSLQDVHVSLAVGSQEHHPALMMWPCHKWWVEGKNYIPWCPLDLLSTLLLMQPRTSLTLFATRAHSCSVPSLVPTRIYKAKPLSIYWCLPQGKDFALVLLKLPQVPVGPCLQPGKACGNHHNHLLLSAIQSRNCGHGKNFRRENIKCLPRNLFTITATHQSALSRLTWERKGLTVSSIGIQILYS